MSTPTKDEITPEEIYHSRRQFIKTSAFASTIPIAATMGIAPSIFTGQNNDEGPTESNNRAMAAAPQWLKQKVKDATPAHRLEKEFPSYSTTEDHTPRSDATSFNNFYEFGFGKSDPAEKAPEYDPYPYRLTVEGEVKNPGEYSLEDLIMPQRLEERVYRLRCVEAWSMVIPWVGCSLSKLIDIFQPTPKARFVAFETHVDRSQMPATRSFFSTIDWPYREGLRLDEAQHHLTLATVGMYGKVLPGQNGPPLRIIIPWKYGFKSIKSVVKMRFTENQPVTSWNDLQPREYGFYANVNPAVKHPRWTQSRERRLPSPSFFRANWIATTPFNGYADEVKDLYKDMDLSLFY